MSPIRALRERFSRLPDADFIGSVGVLASGKSIAVLITILVTPLIARLFEPKDFGVMAQLVALVAPLTALASLRLDQAMVVAQSRDVAYRLMRATLTWLLFSTVLVGALVALLRYFGGADLLPAELIPWLWFVPVALVLNGLVLIAKAWLTREELFAAQVHAEISRSSTTAAGRLATGAGWGSSVAGLVLGYFIGLLAEVTMAWRRLPKDVARPRLTGRAEFVEVVREFRDFPLLNLPASLLRLLRASLPLLALGYLFSAATAGFYSMAMRMIETPGTIVGMAVQRAFLARASKIHAAGRPILTAWSKTSLVLMALAAIPFLVLWLFAKEMLVLLLGAPWSVAGDYAELLAILLFVQWVAAPSVAAIMVLRKQQVLLFAQAFGFIGHVVVFAVSVRLQLDAYATVRLLVVVSATATALISVCAGALLFRSNAADSTP